ncbi:MAG: formate dehydrogenase accessory sulfurtransferase FdhD [Phaeovulum sp.]|uniref:formate dehydrogenase accessory sulfurtransferase FdhD n=2 Tax=Phaeovulum sp. TaxID=2934796 RepID=UPI00272F215C|nr:formate dehydrogenase accessory sulfurtransferase FdhD [Phaeovulum sp.]MDP2063502.1 formate dehydrogenase accessory sulfurtransferase FdhD [Phaeovulum sp.]
MSAPASASRHPVRAWVSGWQNAARLLPEEVPVALVYDGATQAVMMASPADLADFLLGFALTEGLIASAAELTATEIVPQPRGIEARAWLVPGAAARLAARRRAMAGPVGCGLCGIDSIAEALRALPRAVPTSGPRLGPQAPAAALTALAAAQPLHAETRATHAAGFWLPDAGLVSVREDVGRHNALDKLAGALSRGQAEISAGVLVLTSRISVDLVQKAAMIGARVLIGAAAPTALAVAEAEAAAITLVARVRGDSFDVYSHPQRINGEGQA